MIVGSQVIFIVGLPRVTFVADVAVEQVHGVWEGGVSLGSFVRERMNCGRERVLTGGILIK